jgi:hypothetical protein
MPYIKKQTKERHSKTTTTSYRLNRIKTTIQSKINWFEIDTSNTLQKLNSTETLKEKCVIYGLVKKKTETWICMYLTSYDMLLQKKNQ